MSQMSNTIAQPRSDRKEFYSFGGALGIWFFCWGFQWLLLLINRNLSPRTVEDNNGLWFIVSLIVTVLLVLWQRPKIFKLSRIRLRWLDVPVAAGLAYVSVNLSMLVMPPPFDWSRGSVREIVLTVIVSPFLEELLCRGVILRSWMEKMPIAVAIALSA